MEVTKMIFNLKFKTNNEIKKYPSNSAELIFCKTKTEFDRTLKSRDLEAAALQKSKFKESDNSEIKIWKDKNPQLTFIKGTDLKDKFNVDFFRNYFCYFVFH